MPKLSDTQAALLSAAALRADGNVLPLPGSLCGGAASKVAAALLGRGMIREDVIERRVLTDSALNTVWRSAEDGRAVLLRITPEGLEAIGVEPSDATASAAVTASSTADHAAAPDAAMADTSHEAPQRPGAGRTESGASAGY